MSAAMNHPVVSPLALYEGFDPKSGEFRPRLVRTLEDGATVKKCYYFDGPSVPDGVARVYAELEYTHAAFGESNGFLPVIVLPCDIRDSLTVGTKDKLVAAGFAVLAVDFTGAESLPYATIYPESLQYAALDQAEADLYTVKNPHKTAWYIWTILCWRAVHFLTTVEEVDTSRLGIVGCRVGGNIAAALVALEDRIKACALVGNTGWHEYGLLYDKSTVGGCFDDKSAVYNYCLSVESFAQFIKKPTLLCVGSNDAENDFDRAFDTYARISATVATAMSVSPRSGGEVYFAERNNLVKWFDSKIRFEFDYPEPPQLECYVSSGVQYAKVIAPESMTVQIFYAFGEVNYRARNWHSKMPEDFGDGKRIARIEATADDAMLFCFAYGTASSGVTVCSRMIVSRPKEAGVSQKSADAERLLYDSAKSTDCFCTVCAGRGYNDQKELQIFKGPLGIDGITSDCGVLATHKFSDARFAGFDGDLLTIGFYAPENCIVLFSFGVPVGRSWQEYNLELKITGSPMWQKCTLELSDFKNDANLPPKNWESLKRLQIQVGQAAVFLLSTILWT